MPLAFFVLKQYRRVTDRQTDGQTDTLRSGKNWSKYRDIYDFQSENGPGLLYRHSSRANTGPMAVRLDGHYQHFQGVLHDINGSLWWVNLKEKIKMNGQ